jgi:uncharacterized small protein (DUF1192 family)
MMILRFLILAAAGAFALMVYGCCDDCIDDDKSPAQIKSEAASMSVADIEKRISAYNRKIEKKGLELKAEVEKLAKIPLEDQFSEHAKDIREDIDDLKEDIAELQAQLSAYVDTLAAKK